MSETTPEHTIRYKLQWKGLDLIFRPYLMTLGTIAIGGCAAYLCVRWMRGVENAVREINSSVEEMTETVSYIKHRLRTRDCCSCYGTETKGNDDNDVHHCDRERFLTLIGKMLVSDVLDVSQAYYMMKNRISESRNDAAFMVLIARAAYAMSKKHRKHWTKSCEDKKKAYLMEAYKYSSLALKIDINSETTMWNAIILYSLSKTMPCRERMRNFRKIDDRMDAAVTLNSGDPRMLHYIGRWHYELATMCWSHRFLVRLLEGFNEIPTLEAAREDFMFAQHLDPYSRVNHLYIALTYAYEGDWASGILWAERGLAIRSRDADKDKDKELTDQLNRLLKYMKPRT